MIERTSKKLKYSELVEMLASLEDVSKHRASLFAKEYSEVLKSAIKDGFNITVEGLFTIKYVGKDCNVVENTDFGAKEQLIELERVLMWDRELIKRLFVSYLKLMRDKVEQGYQLNLKSVGYIVPFRDKETNELWYLTRYSPVLELSETIKVVVMNEVGEYTVEVLEEGDVHIRMVVSENLKPPKMSNIDEDFEFEVVEL